MSDDPCRCRDALQWREYWTEEAIRARLAEELATYAQIRSERIAEACQDMRGPARIGLPDVLMALGGPPHEEMHRRRYG